MSAIFDILLRSAGVLIVTASAQSPTAVVEEIQGSVPGVQFMDYVDPGQVIRLGAHDRIVLGYLRSCWRETISSGTVTVGTEQSEVAGGEVARDKVACEGGKMMLSAELAGKSGAMVFRQAPKPQAVAAVPHPEFTLYGLSPVFELRPPGQACGRTPGSAGRTPRDRRHRAAARARRVSGFCQVGRGAGAWQNLPGQTRRPADRLQNRCRR